MAPTGYLNSKNKDEKCQVIVDAKRAPVIKQMFEKVANENYSGRKIFKWLKEIEFKNKNGKYVTISVEDQGPGIGKDHLEKVFQKFYRVETAGPAATLALSRTAVGTGGEGPARSDGRLQSD